MTAIWNTSRQTRPASQRLAETLLDWVGAARQHILLQRSRRKLHQLPDHILHDIGIQRSEIDSITVYRGRDITRRNRF